MNTFVNNLRQEVLSGSINRFRLENDLRNLDKVYSSGATEAVVFYSARIMEAILKDAHLQFFGESRKTRGKKPVLADIENELYNYNLLMQSRYYWAKGLRLLGNDVRHSLRRVNTEEADCALVFLEFILSWIFCEFPFGQRHTTIYKAQNSISRSAGNRLLDLAWALDSSRLKPDTLKVVFGVNEQAYLESFSRNFTFPLLLIEIFIAQGDHASARRLINSLSASQSRPKGALKNRFLQLKGLLFSREGKLDEALQLLESEYLRQKQEREWIEDETVGILAGVYKRIWDKDQKENFLEKSYETYRSGWNKNKNTYLGINAAATALWQNKYSEARGIVGEVKSILKQRRMLIRQKTNSRYDLNYWDLVTLAEASLMDKDYKLAGELYAMAFLQHKNQSENIDVTRRQLAKVVSFLNPSDSELRALNYSWLAPKGDQA